MSEVDLLAVITTASEKKLEANPVPVPELKDKFPQGVQPQMYVASLSGSDKDAMDEYYRDYREELGLETEDSWDTYRSFCIAYCLCDSKNKRLAKNKQQVFALANSIVNLANPVVTRLYNVANGANAFTGLRESDEKKSSTTPKKQKKGAGNGESPSAQDAPAAQPG